MGLRLLLYLGALIIGGILGKKFQLNKKLQSKLSLIQSLCLLFLLFIMGLKIGLDKNILSSFLNIGFKAFVINIFTVGFSVLGVFLVRKIIVKNGG